MVCVFFFGLEKKSMESAFYHLNPKWHLLLCSSSACVLLKSCDTVYLNSYYSHVFHYDLCTVIVKDVDYFLKI